ncbi:MAG TPA: ABC transporter permease [Mycobacteriales bacterium]|nr:ABC transporter permease [Mycobacteriales bacterium]
MTGTATRTLNAARLQLIPYQTNRFLPWGILGISFAINLLIYSLLGPEDRANGFTGGLASIYVVFFAAYVRAMVQVFPFALGMGVTRRRFYTATALLAVTESVAYGVILYLLRLVEDATDGWGVSMRFFGITYLVQDNPLLQILVYAVPLGLLAFVGVFVGGVFRRWGMNGVYTLAIAVIAVLGGLAALVTWQRWWDALGGWFTDQSPLTLLAGLPAALAAALAAAAFLTIRRATP